MKINKKSIQENILHFQKRLDDLERIISSNKYYNLVEKMNILKK
jgi:prephenate dehydrogenase